MNKEPTFTYAFKQDRHQQQHSNSSPMTDAGGGGENTTDSPPTTSFEELVTSSSSVLVLPYTDHAQLPHLPPKSPSRTTQKHQQPTRINLPELQTSFELQHGHEHDQDQESRDQLSPLLSSPRKLDYTYASKNIISPPTAYITPVSPPTSDDNGHEQVHVQAGKSPSRRRPFFTFGNRNVIGNAQSITKPPSHPPKIGNNDGRNVAATSLDSLGRDKAIIQGARNTKSSKHVRRNSADDVDVYNHHGRPSSMDHAAHSSTESTSPNERESISSLTGDMKAMTAHDNISQDKRSSRSLTKGLVASLGRRSRSSSRSTAEITPPLPKSSIATASQAKPGSEDGGIIPTPKWKAYENRQTRPNGMVAALQEDWVEITPSPAQAIASKGDGPDIMDGNKASEIHSKSRSPPYPINRKKYLSSTNTTTEPSKLNSPYLPKTPSPIKLRHRALPANWRNETTSLPDGSPSPHPVKNDSAMPHATVSPASPPYSPPPRENLRSPPFFMRGRLAGQKKGNTPGSGVSSNNPRSPVKKGVYRYVFRLAGLLPFILPLPLLL